MSDSPRSNQDFITRVRVKGEGHAPERVRDHIAVEEPLEVRIRGQAYAVLMRTPGRERDLVAGFLAAEGILAGRSDLLAMEACKDPHSQRPEANIWNVSCAEDLAFDPRQQRRTVVSSSCGLCGTRSLQELQELMPPAVGFPSLRFSLSQLQQAFSELGRQQSLFAATAGCHGAALWNPQSKDLVDLAEDVGRHNAVDKLIGARLWADDYPVSTPLALLLSGRISFELVQKAALAGIPLLAGMGMPTSLAVAAAQTTGQTLLGWVRDGGASVYAGEVLWQDDAGASAGNSGCTPS